MLARMVELQLKLTQIENQDEDLIMVLIAQTKVLFLSFTSATLHNSLRMSLLIPFAY